MLFCIILSAPFQLSVQIFAFDALHLGNFSSKHRFPFRHKIKKSKRLLTDRLTDSTRPSMMFLFKIEKETLCIDMKN